MSTHLRVFEPGISDTFESALRRFFSPVQLDQALQMRLDISENKDTYAVKADLPGVKKDDINVRIDGNIVQIDAEVEQEKETKGSDDKVLRSKRYYGSVSRTFSLPQDVDEAKAQATYAEGVLTLELPKKATAASKKLTVR